MEAFMQSPSPETEAPMLHFAAAAKGRATGIVVKNIVAQILGFLFIGPWGEDLWSSNPNVISSLVCADQGLDSFFWLLMEMLLINKFNSQLTRLMVVPCYPGGWTKFWFKILCGNLGNEVSARLC